MGVVKFLATGNVTNRRFWLTTKILATLHVGKMLAIGDLTKIMSTLDVANILAKWEDFKILATMKTDFWLIVITLATSNSTYRDSNGDGG